MVQLKLWSFVICGIPLYLFLLEFSGWITVTNIPLSLCCKIPDLLNLSSEQKIGIRNFNTIKALIFFLNLDPESIWFNLIMSKALCHQYQFGLRGFEDCGDRKKERWGNSICSGLLGGKQKYDMWNPLVFSKIIYAHSSVLVYMDLLASQAMWFKDF